MNKNLILLLTVVYGTVVMTSCAGSYSVKGTSNISNLDGRMLFLKMADGDGVKNIDSCDVVHGQFHFHGNIDSAKVVNICMEDDQVMPIVLENGEVSVKIDDTQLSVSGTPLNDKINAFMTKFVQISSEKADLIHRHDQAIMDGKDMDETIAQLQQDEVKLNVQEDSLVTNFISQNYDNILGPWCFAVITADYEYPVLTPWIEDIMSKATEKFKNDPLVKDYYDKAQENQQILNGTK